MCRHRGSQLFPTEPGSGPQLCGARSIRCPYHSWTYALDGSLLRAPHTEDGDVEPSRVRVCTPVGVEAWGGFVFVHLTPGAARPLTDSVGRADRTLANYDLGSLSTGLTFTYDVAANWKVVAENYNECYHCGPVHPELSPAGAVVRRWRAGPRLGRRHPASRGRLDVHDDRHHDRAPLPGARRGREGAAQG